MLTTKQHGLYTFIVAHIRQHGVAPTHDEMANAMGLASKSGVTRMLNGMEKRGYIRRMKGLRQAIEVLK